MGINEAGPRWGEEHYLQHFMVGSDGKMYFIPPAMTKNELLEQIRVVMREELQAYRDTSYWEKLTEEQKRAVNDWRSLVSQMLTEKVALFQEKYPGLQIETYFRSDVLIKEQATRDTSTDEQVKKARQHAKVFTEMLHHSLSSENYIFDEDWSWPYRTQFEKLLEKNLEAFALAVIKDMEQSYEPKI